MQQITSFPLPPSHTLDKGFLDLRFLANHRTSTRLPRTDNFSTQLATLQLLLPVLAIYLGNFVLPFTNTLLSIAFAVLGMIQLSLVLSCRIKILIFAMLIFFLRMGTLL